jgi:hypothetical protein
MRLPPITTEPAAAVQLSAHRAAAPLGEAEPAHEIAAHGVSGAGQALPHGNTIQRLFGRHDISDVQAHVGGPAATASERLGADAYATGRSVGFRSAPDLHTAAHEAAHLVQQARGVQLAGGVGRVGDVYERNADEVADAVVTGRSAECLLDRFAGGGAAGPAVQKKADAPYDLTGHQLSPLKPGTTLADITSWLTKTQSATPPGITSWKANGVKPGSTEEIYVLYAIWAIAKPDQWGAESDMVTEVGPGTKGAIQVRFDTVGNAVGTLVSATAPKVAATFTTVAAGITSLKKTFDLADIRAEKSQAWTPDQLNKLSAAWSKLGTSEIAALSKYTVILTDNTLEGGTASGLTTREDKLSSDGLTAIKTREIRFTVGMFDVDKLSFTGDSTNAAPASSLTLIHEAAHAVSTKPLDDANAAQMTAAVEVNKATDAGNAANKKTVASRNVAATGHWNKFKAADQKASEPLVNAFDDAHTAITAFRDEHDAAKMAPLEAPAVAAVKARDTAKAGVPAANPAHAAYAPAIVDQDAYLRVCQTLLAKRQAHSAATTKADNLKDPKTGRSVRLQAFVDFVTANNIEPVTKYAKDNWPAKPGEFYSEALALWHSDPTFFDSYSNVLKKWFDDGKHLQ